jgi:hypothetical protein
MARDPSKHDDDSRKEKKQGACNSRGSTRRDVEENDSCGKKLDEAV